MTESTKAVENYWLAYNLIDDCVYEAISQATDMYGDSEEVTRAMFAALGDIRDSLEESWNTRKKLDNHSATD